jgi:hypothetical protein
MIIAKTVLKKRSRGDKQRHGAHWINEQLICDCGSRVFAIFREKVARKVRTRSAHRRRRVAVCRNGRKTRISFQ